MPEVIHVCNTCFDIPVDVLIKFRVFIKFAGNDRLKIEIPLGEEVIVHLFDMHWSIDNNDFGMNKCPNYLYLITFEVKDKDGNPVANKEIIIPAAIPHGQKRCSRTMAEPSPGSPIP